MIIPTHESHINIEAIIEKSIAFAGANPERKDLEFLISCIDHTDLAHYHTEESVNKFVQSAPKGVASLCVFASMVEGVGLALGDSSLRICSVAGGFPSGQTYLEVKLLEVAMAIENGADEIDIPMNIGAVIGGEIEVAKSEIQAIAQEIDSEALLKVIIESGELSKAELIYSASKAAIEAGADFIKTSTGKTSVGATPKAVAVMCTAILDSHKATGEMVGLKVSGGVSTIKDGLVYYNIVKEILGEKWLSNQYFRIGSSSLAFEISNILNSRD